ncbi:MAG: DUF480 domain-containing protein [Gemmataceae bacterium]
MPDPLPPYERRVLGVLIEKQKTSKSADAYPMTLNAITTGCNQKSNRDPVYELDEDTVEETLAALQKKGLVMKMTGGRADRFRHLLYEEWKATKTEMAVLAELLLRGPQSEGDLRGRADRMEDIPDLDALRAMLTALAGRGQVLYLTEPNRRGTVVTHGFHTPDELERGEGPARRRGGRRRRPPPPPRAGLEARLAEAFDEIARLKERVTKLEERAGTHS